jgi:hypothetical protein
VAGEHREAATCHGSCGHGAKLVGLACRVPDVEIYVGDGKGQGIKVTYQSLRVATQLLGIYPPVGRHHTHHRVTHFVT